MWHTLTSDEVLKKAQTRADTGLSVLQASRRLEEYGKNVLPRGKEKHWWYFLIRQFKSPLVYILLIGALLSLFLREFVDVGVILLAVVVNVAIGFWQEYRSSSILEKLEAIIRVRAFAVRDGKINDIPAEELVQGDIILLKMGNKVPADARLLSAKYLEISEAILTGESAPVRKVADAIVSEGAPIGDRSTMAHMGTIISRGEGTAVVVETGATTEIGKIALLTQQAEDEPTPLQVRIAKLGQIITYFVVASAVIILVVGLMRSHPFREIFTTAIAVAVAAIPEGLPAAISIVLAVSAQRILKRKGVVKHLLAAETLGSASVICSDKTGTLTLGEMKVEKLIAYGNEKRLLDNLALSNEAVVEQAGDKPLIRGEVTDVAKMEAFFASGGRLSALLAKYPRHSLLAFDPARKYIASLHQNKKNLALFLSGAPEVVLGLASDYIDNGSKKKLSKAKREEFETTYRGYAENGYRVLGCAERTIRTQDTEENDTELEDEKTRERLVQKLSFVGFVAIHDPVRKDVREAFRTATNAGIRSIMLTGDHMLTAKAIGREIGFTVAPGTVLEGSEIDALGDEQLGKRLQKTAICARVNPAHKMRIIDALQRHGDVVAMTGDGVNDAPALKAADIGVAVDAGTDVAKEASDLILLNNSYAVIIAAIEQGRIAFDNIRKVTVFLLAGSFTELLLIMVPLLLNMPLPVTAVMILWTNLVEDSLPNVALAFEPGEQDIMRRKPVKKNVFILDAESKVIVYVIGPLTDLILLGLYLFLATATTLPFAQIQTFIFAALGLDTFFYIYSIKSLRKPIYSYHTFNNPYLIAATIIGIGLMLAAIYVPLFNTLLGTVPLRPWHWLVVLFLGCIEILGVELVKWFFFWRKDKKSPVLSRA